MKLTIKHIGEEIKEEWHTKIIDMYTKGLIEFAPSYIVKEDGSLVIQEISVVMTQKFRDEKDLERAFEIVKGENGNPIYARKEKK